MQETTTTTSQMQTDSNNTSSTSPATPQPAAQFQLQQTPDSPRITLNVDSSRLLDMNPAEMSEEELQQYVQLIRARRTSNQLALENKRGAGRKDKEKEKSDSPVTATKNAKLLGDLLAD
jgi:hypothetical protein